MSKSDKGVVVKGRERKVVGVLAGLGSVDWWKWSFLFLVFGVAGWIFETVAIVVTDQELMVRGLIFVTEGGMVWGMPILVMYGIGGVILMWMGRILGKTWQVFWLGGVVAMTIFELVVSYLMEWLTGYMYWVYRTPLNFQGRISVLSSVAWGVLAVLVVKWLGPKMEGMYEKVAKRRYFKLVVVVLLAWTAICVGVREGTNMGLIGG
ncbi:putative ABC transporter permease [Candidatus Saccharibacteria bacterium]|nr:putative ABC transporter permease [Candidatus Saccharibacteria bacterium]